MWIVVLAKDSINGINFHQKENLRRKIGITKARPDFHRIATCIFDWGEEEVERKDLIFVKSVPEWEPPFNFRQIVSDNISDILDSLLDCVGNTFVRDITFWTQ